MSNIWPYSISFRNSFWHSKIAKWQSRNQRSGNGPKAEKVSWYKCLDEHLHCESCFNRLSNSKWKLKKIWKKCEIMTNEKRCNELVPDQLCKVIEALLNMKSMRFNCENEREGCKELLDREALTDHPSECNYRRVPCPIPCRFQDEVPFNEVLDHLKNDHHFGTQELSFNEKHINKINFKIEKFLEKLWKWTGKLLFILCMRTMILFRKSSDLE